MGVTQAEATEYLREELGKDRISWVLASTKAGAGHKRQARHLERYLKEYLHQEEVQTVDISLESSSSFWVRWGTLMYNRYMQNSPRVYEQVEKILAWSGWKDILDKQVRAMARPEVFSDITDKRGTIVAGTHVAGVVSAVQAGFPDVVEYVPDPWRGGSLRLMTSPERADNNHLTVVHDTATAIRVRGMREDGRAVLPWGTLSNPDFVLGERKTCKPMDRSRPLRVLVEMSGNSVSGYNEKIAEWMREAAGEISSGKIDLTIHCMHHKDIYGKLSGLTEELGLEKSGNVHLQVGENLQEAIEGRERCITGKDDGRPPDVCIAKGGEVPLEERGGMIVAMPWGWGHEGADLMAGVRQGTGIDLRDTDVSEWLEKIRKKMEKRERQEINNWSLMAVGMLIDPEYFGRIKA